MKRTNEYLYTKLAGILREQIYSGYIKPGELLLSENQLAEYYEISRVSVRKSLDILLNEGLVIKKTGRGTMVVPSLNIPGDDFKTLNILATSPSFYVDAAMKEIIGSFNKLYPNIKVNVISVPGRYLLDNQDDIENAKIKIDLIFVGDEQISKLRPEECFQDLSRILKDCGCEERIYDKIAGYCRRGDGIYGVPVTFSTVFLAYNPGLFLKYGVDLPWEGWSEEVFLSAMDRLTSDTNGDGIVDQFGFSISPVSSRWLTVALRKGADFKNIAEESGALNETLAFLHDVLFRKRSAVLFWNSNSMANPFYNQRSAMTLTTAFELSGWKNSPMGFKPKVAPMPFDEKEGSVLIANYFLIPAGCKNSEMAHAFIKTAIDTEVQKSIAEKYKLLSALEDINRSVYRQDYLKSINVNRGLKDGKFISELLPEKRILFEIETEMEAYWSGIDSSQIAAQKICDILRDE